MKLFAGLLISAAMFAAPAWADEPQVVESTVAEFETNSAPIKWYESFVYKANEDAEKKSFLVAPTTETDEFGLAWSGNGRWGLTLDMTRRSGDDVHVLPEEEITAGAFYQFSPRFRIGGGISIGGERLSQDTSSWVDQENETGVRIESAFSF
ncbi:NtrZ family periplasmic regulatory protein [Hirschia baltica]|uniref:Uncharacterized protein n=1 Tax=Hirschia baltica (strain ATCC 49814 / DSM 5838 / IFAM 1418) TaxID=582402 RepID=C6XKB4_HIRBI|nr:hypothetical protein [Hirschia baltica]ACT57712.1 hypothetical protein Hbal_0010 [Hirschia baltica ATCC 49814]